MSITYSECVFLALVIEYEKRMRSITLSSLACVDVPYYFQITS